MTQVKKVTQSALTDPLIKHVKELEQFKLVDIPKDYSIANALNSAFYIIKEEVKNSDKKPALDVCTMESIQHCLKRMVTQGLNPAKKQCYFIVTGNKLTMLDSYFGHIALAIRYGNLENEPNCNLVYENDELETTIDLATGYESLALHRRGASRDMKKIKGAYALAKSKTGKIWFEYMDIEQIKRAWAKGNQLMKKTKSGFQEGFTDRACKRTVISRLCREIYYTSNDSEILSEYKENENIEDIQETIEIKEDFLKLEEPKTEFEKPKETKKPEKVNEPAKEKQPEPKQQTLDSSFD